EQKITPFSLVLGTKACGGIGVADPKRLHDTAPRTISRPAGIELAIASMLFSYLPTFRPTTFIMTAIARPVIATAMKYTLLVDQACHDGPPMNSAFAAAK